MNKYYTTKPSLNPPLADTNCISQRTSSKPPFRATSWAYRTPVTTVTTKSHNHHPFKTHLSQQRQLSQLSQPNLTIPSLQNTPVPTETLETSVPTETTVPTVPIEPLLPSSSTLKRSNHT